MRRLFKIAVAATVATAAIGGGLGLAGEASASHSTSAATSSTTHTQAGKSYLVVNIRNDSNYDMTYLDAGGGTPNEIPKPVLHKGDTDRLVFMTDSTGGASAHLSYRVGDTKETVYPRFSVPWIGPNGFACSANDRSANSPVGSKCDIGSGYQPDAHLTFVNR
jgi:hypothetical protein